MADNIEQQIPANTDPDARIAKSSEILRRMMFSLSSLEPEFDEVFATEADKDVAYKIAERFFDYYGKPDQVEPFVRALYQLDGAEPANRPAGDTGSQKTGRLATQRAILSAESSWGIGLGEPSYNQASPRMEP